VSGLAVLLLTGPTDSWRSYQPVLDLLPRGVRAIAVPQRGHGESGKPGTGYRVEDFAATQALGTLRAGTTRCASAATSPRSQPAFGCRRRS
jgi:non-heme chloroperoxidase